MRVAIHQPNFFPWIGLFYRIALVDQFVFFDNVPAMGGKSWLSRNKLLINNEISWLTIPTRKKGRLGQKISEVEINYDIQFMRKHLRSLEFSYQKTPYFGEVFPVIKKIYHEENKYLADFNKDFITYVCDKLELTVQFITSTKLIQSRPNLAPMNGNDLVLAICQTIGANEYLSGTGCTDFILPETFAHAGISFQYVNFQHPQYHQQRRGEFISHLSILDALFNIGFSKTKEIISAV